MNTGKITNVVSYIALGVAGWLILLLCNLLHQVEPPKNPKYYYSNLFQKNYLGPGILFFIAIGFLAGYYYKLNPWLCGFFLCLVFPATAITESEVYRGSHNLIPFELGVHFIYALPIVGATALGALANKQMRKQKQDDLHQT